MTFGVLALIVAAGLIGPLLSGIRKLTIPLVVGEIGAGILLGVSGLGWLDTADQTLQFLSNTGFAMLMFLVGTHLPLRDPSLRKALGRGLLATVISFALAIPVAYLLARATGVAHPALIVLLLATSSAAVVMPIVNERKLDGMTVLLTTTWVAVADTLTIIALPLAASTGKTLQIALGALIVIALAVASGFALRAFYAAAVGEYYRALSKERHWALDLRLSLILLFSLAALATHFGTSILVAGFAAGAVVSLVGEPRRFFKQLIGIAEGFFVPLFFVVLGAKLDFSKLLHSPVDLALTALLAVATTAVHLLAGKLARLPLASGLTASAQLGVPAAVVSVGLANNLLTDGQAAAIIAAALVSLVTCSIGTALLARHSTAQPPPPAKP